MARIRHLTTVTQIVAAIDKAGGKGSFRRMVAASSKRPKQSVANYKRANRLPPKIFLVVTSRLEEIGCAAPPDLFGIIRSRVQSGPAAAQKQQRGPVSSPRAPRPARRLPLPSAGSSVREV